MSHHAHAHHVCPWWIGYLLASPLRRLKQDPSKILAPFVSEGMTVLEPGPGMGFFTLELARRVGATGKVIAIDIQPKMVEALKRRAEKSGLGGRISTRLVESSGMGVEDLSGKVDFVLAFAMVHEVPDADRFFNEVATALKAGGKVLVAEPSGRVPTHEFAETLEKAARAGLRVEGRPEIRSSHAAVLVKDAG